MNGRAPCIKSGHKSACNLEGLLFSVDQTYRNLVTAMQSLYEYMLGFFPLVYYFSITDTAIKRKGNFLLTIHMEKLILLPSSLPAFKFSLSYVKVHSFSTTDVILDEKHW
jgi:hypothetical protein